MHPASAASAVQKLLSICPRRAIRSLGAPVMRKPRATSALNAQVPVSRFFSLLERISGAPLWLGSAP
jgi:hypothetical protein